MISCPGGNNLHEEGLTVSVYDGVKAMRLFKKKTLTGLARTCG
jgi:hypothetical protein